MHSTGPGTVEFLSVVCARRVVEPVFITRASQVKLAVASPDARSYLDEIRAASEDLEAAILSRQAHWPGDNLASTMRSAPEHSAGLPRAVQGHAMGRGVSVTHFLYKSAVPRLRVALARPVQCWLRLEVPAGELGQAPDGLRRVLGLSSDSSGIQVVVGLVQRLAYVSALWRGRCALPMVRRSSGDALCRSLGPRICPLACGLALAICALCCTSSRSQIQARCGCTFTCAFSIPLGIRPADATHWRPRRARLRCAHCGAFARRCQRAGSFLDTHCRTEPTLRAW